MPKFWVCPFCGRADYLHRRREDPVGPLMLVVCDSAPRDTLGAPVPVWMSWTWWRRYRARGQV